MPLFSSQWYVWVSTYTQINCSSLGLRGKLFGGVKVKRARSFSGREKQKWNPTKDARDGRFGSFEMGSSQLSLRLRIFKIFLFPTLAQNQ